MFEEHRFFAGKSDSIATGMIHNIMQYYSKRSRMLFDSCYAFLIVRPPKLIIRIALLLTIISLLVFVLTALSAQLGVMFLTNSLARLGIVMLFTAFSILIATAFLALSKKILLSIAAYFSSANRSQRNALYLQSKHNQIDRQFYFRTLQIRYWTQKKIKQMLNKNNQQQLRALSNDINKELQELKKNLPASTFKQLQLENRSHLNRQDIEALLELQQKISSLI